MVDQCRILKFKGFVLPSFIIIFFSDALSEGNSVDLFSGELILALLSRQVCYGMFPQFLLEKFLIFPFRRIILLDTGFWIGRFSFSALTISRHSLLSRMAFEEMSDVILILIPL